MSKRLWIDCDGVLADFEAGECRRLTPSDAEYSAENHK